MALVLLVRQRTWHGTARSADTHDPAEARGLFGTACIRFVRQIERDRPVSKVVIGS